MRAVWFSVTITLLLLQVCLCDERKCCAGDHEIQNAAPYNCYDEDNNVTTPNVMKCNTEPIVFLNDSQHTLTLNTQGQLIIENNNRNSSFDPIDEYCIQLSTVGYIGAVVCSDDDDEDDGEEEPTIDNSQYVFGSLLLVSVFFYVVTAAVYALPELRDFYGKSITSLCACLAVFFLIFATLYLETTREVGAPCDFRGLLAYLCMVAAFLWLGAIGVKILISIRYPSLEKADGREFLRYSGAVWLLTLLIFSIVVILNYVEGAHIPPGMKSPTCFLNGFASRWAYMYSIITIVLVIDTAIFVYAWIHLRKTQPDLTASKLELRYTLRLFLVLGLSWFLEMISTFISSKSGFVYFLNVIIMLQGLSTFIVMVVLRPRALKALNQMGALVCCSGYVEGVLTKVGDDEDQKGPHRPVPTMVES